MSAQSHVVVDVMLKPEILDPQGRAVVAALGRLHVDGVVDVRQGKRFEITLEGEVTEDRLAELHRMAAQLLSNPVIENYVLHIQS
ncbi:MAG: phosphoribosylformylglycinamidine synthase subunit PurS [Actinomycetes bacterium]